MDWVPGVVVAVIELAILLYYFTDFSYKAKSTVWKRLRIYVLVTLLSLLTWAVFDNLFLRTIFVILFLALAFMQMYTGNKWFIAFYVVTCVLVMLFTEVMVNTGIKALLRGLYHSDAQDHFQEAAHEGSGIYADADDDQYPVFCICRRLYQQ